MADDDELITAEWWDEQFGNTFYCAFPFFYISFSAQHGVFVECKASDTHYGKYKTPAVRTRGEVRQLVKLLGRE